MQFTRQASEVRGLATGDYSVKGFETRFAVERKSIADLVACCTGDNRARFEAELVRLRGCWFRRWLIVGKPTDVLQHRYRSNVVASAVFATLAAFDVRYDSPFVFQATPVEAAARVKAWAAWFWRERQREADILLKIAPGPKSEREKRQGVGNENSVQGRPEAAVMEGSPAPH